MKERGRYQIQFMKTRSSSGVGQKVDLEFNVDTLRISDLGEEGESEGNITQSSNNSRPTTQSVMDGLKRSSVVSTSSVDVSKILPKPKSGGMGESAAPKIRSFLNDLNSEQD
jgi:hypothetical protein